MCYCVSILTVNSLIVEFDCKGDSLTTRSKQRRLYDSTSIKVMRDSGAAVATAPIISTHSHSPSYTDVEFPPPIEVSGPLRFSPALQI